MDDDTRVTYLWEKSEKSGQTAVQKGNVFKSNI